MFGGPSLTIILLKMVTRLVPLWFAASRAVEVVEVLAVVREKNKTVRIPVQIFEKEPTKKQHLKHRPQTVISRVISQERDERSTRAPTPVPVSLGVSYILSVWVFCVFAWARIAQLATPCAAAGTPWPTYCRAPAHPLFDFALPGPSANLCACNTFAAAPKDGKQMNVLSTSYDCTSPRFMADVRSGLFTQERTAPFVQTMMFEAGCAVNNTHVEEMIVELSNLRVLYIAESSAIVPPLRLPGAAMKKESQLMAIRLDKMGIEKIPSEIGRLSETLSILVIKRNPKLREVPREVGDCNKLTALYLEANVLTAVPSELGRIAGLAALDLTQNKLTSLPNELGSLAGLQELWLSDNHLSAVPSSFGRMSSLAKLNMAGNLLSAVPVLNSDLQAWPHLRYMNLEGNNISSWPNGWEVKRNETVAALPFNTTARAVGDERNGLYDTYVTQRQTKVTVGGKTQAGGSLLASNVRSVISLLVLMGGNLVVGNNGSDDARLLEMSRDSAAGKLPWMLVSSRPNCAPGCESTPWKAGGLRVLMRDFRGDSNCNVLCNVLSCQYDGGDCLR